MLSALVIESFLHMKQKLLAELLAEFLGTMVLILFGTGVVAMVVLFGHGLPGEIVNGGYSNITLAWGLAGAAGSLLARDTNRAPLKPAAAVTPPAYVGVPRGRGEPPSSTPKSRACRAG